LMFILADNTIIAVDVMEQVPLGKQAPVGDWLFWSPKLPK